MAQPRHISISEAARLLGKNRETILKKGRGPASIPGRKNARLYDADADMRAVYLGRDYYIWQLEQAVDESD